MKQLDEIDEKILSMLLADSRTPHTKIAEECGVSSPTILNRIKKLKEKGLIVREYLFFNLDYFGYRFVAMIGINLKIGNEKKISEIIGNQVLAIAIDYTVGKYDICAFIASKQLDDIDRLKYFLRKQQGVYEVDIHIYNKIDFFRDEILIGNVGV